MLSHLRSRAHRGTRRREASGVGAAAAAAGAQQRGGQGQMQQIRRGVAETGLGVRGDRAVADQEDRAGPLQRRRPQQGDAAKHEDDRRHQRDADQALLVVDGQPAVVDRQPAERLVAQAHAEQLLRGRPGRRQQGVPDLGPAGEAGEVLLALSAQEPRLQRGAEPHRGHRGASTAQVKNRRAAALVSRSEPIASASPMNRPSVAVRVWVSASRPSDGTMTSTRWPVGPAAQDQSSTVSPMMTAAYCPICGGVSGHSAPTRRPP